MPRPSKSKRSSKASAAGNESSVTGSDPKHQHFRVNLKEFAALFGDVQRYYSPPATLADLDKMHGEGRIISSAWIEYVDGSRVIAFRTNDGHVEIRASTTLQEPTPPAGLQLRDEIARNIIKAGRKPAGGPPLDLTDDDLQQIPR